jgi:YYY domain-containing protein
LIEQQEGGLCQEHEETGSAVAKPRQGWRPYLYEILLILVLILGAVLRFSGLNWDEDTHLHPDERFLTMVESDIQFPDSLGEYFNTASSPLNPRNAGHGFFVYGTLPIFLVRFLAALFDMAGYGQVYLLGRAAAGIFDLITIFLIYVTAVRLYSKRVGILAAAFTAVSVLLIQHAHYFVVDTFATTFVVAGFFFAVRVLDEGDFKDYALFGLTLGLAVASKVSTFPLAAVVAVAGGIRLLDLQGEDSGGERRRVIVGVLLAAGISLLTFRIFQPYAFAGTSFFDVRLNPKWLDNMRELRSLSSGRAEFPPAWQWAGRPRLLYSLRNLVLWGLGAPLGITACLSLAWALGRSFQGHWRKHLLPVIWISGYFVWQAAGFTQAMRYQLPIYPFLALMAAWGLWRAWELAGESRRLSPLAGRAVVAAVGAAVLISTTVYAIGFVTIYTRPVTRVAASRWIFRNVPAAANMVVQSDEEQFIEPISMPVDYTLLAGEPYTAVFRSGAEGRTADVLLPHVSGSAGDSEQLDLRISISGDPEGAQVLSAGEFSGRLTSASDAPVEISLQPALDLHSGEMYYATISLESGGAIHMRGSVIISESSWDDGLPLRIDGRDGYGGYYQGVNQELYWPDNSDDDSDGKSDKLERILSTLEQGDYLVISSNRQYGSIARIGSRYPLTQAYYRALFGCAAPQSIPRCAAAAQPGKMDGELGYELIAVFQSNPRLGPLEINDQLAEEAFTVYDHPKVLVFKRSPDFDVSQARRILAGIDLTHVENVLPKDARAGGPGTGGVVGDLMLPEDQWKEQRVSGTWSELFPDTALINRSQILAVGIWWLFVGVLGLVTFPWVQIAFGGLRDWGYPLSRVVGLLLLSWGSWVLGSAGVPFTRPTILIVLVAMLLCSGSLAWRDRKRLLGFFRERWRSLLWIEALALGFFLFFLLVRLGNPDLWHPGRGGEKPMDFSYLNAVLKSVSFPPYDPWYAGGYINYYYYGFVLVGVPVKLLGLVPDVAYNLILPTLYAMVALGAFCVGSNLVASAARSTQDGWKPQPWLAGIMAAVGMGVIGNLGTVSLIYEGLKRLGAGADQALRTSFGGLLQALSGLNQLLLGGQSMPFGLGSWYWDPSRAIPPGIGEPGPITEFPYFTFLYADLHAHMINMPLTLGAAAWALSWILAAKRRRRLRWLDTGLAMFTGGLLLGALRPTNSWDFPAYWGLGALALVFGAWLRERLPWRSALEALFGLAVVFGLAWILYSPFSRWFGQAYTAVGLWEGGRTPLNAYLTVHGIFLFVISSWMAWETWRWLAETPISALGKLRPFARAIAFGILVTLGLIAYLAARGYPVVVIALPIMIWAGILWLRPGQSVEKRAVLTMVAAAVALTFGVEVVVLQGDIGRMNTVFKFYLQVWTLFSVSAAAGLFWLFQDLRLWAPTLRRIWLVLLAGLVCGGLLYPLTATPAKIKDRMAADAPHTLDGMRFMAYSTYADLGQIFPLDEDYRAIRWMRENVSGTPVIVEANAPEYRWGSRYTIYTGLPGVLGWNWHQRQQRAAYPEAGVAERAREITQFYLTPSAAAARQFIERYEVRYVVVGRLERIYFEQIYPCWVEDAELGIINCDFSGRPVGMSVPEVPAAECQPMDAAADPNRLACPTHGLEKFGAMAAEGYLKLVYQEGETEIYEVMP